METLYEMANSLTKTQIKAKEARDAEYQLASKVLSSAYYEKKRTVGVTAQETADYEVAYKQLWDDYVAWGVTNGIMIEITPEKQLARGEVILLQILQEVNDMRAELGQLTIAIQDPLAKVRL